MSTKFEHRNFRDESFRPLTTALGELTLAWNDLQETLGCLFWAALGFGNGLIPLTIWHAIKVDRAQRDMIEAITKLDALGLDIPAKARKEIAWVLTRVTSLEDQRNDALHSPFIRSRDKEIVPFHGLGHARAKKLKDKNLLKEFRWFYETTIVLRDYAMDLTEVLRRESVAFPDRPRLPNRGDTKTPSKQPRQA